MEVLIVAILLGLIPATIAHNKGHNSFLWWFCGAGMFIVALPCAILLKPNVKALEQRKLTEGMRKCPSCAELIQVDAASCRYCGRKLGETPAEEAAVGGNRGHSASPGRGSIRI